MTLADTWMQYSDNPEVLRYIAYLEDRYEDEREYEDWNMYDEAIKKKLPNTLKTEHSPIRIAIQCDDGVLQITLQEEGTKIYFVAEQVKA